MKTISLKGKYGFGNTAIIDDTDFDLVSQYNWFARPAGIRGRTLYAESSAKGKRLLLHRFLMGTPTELDTDHINGNGLDNRRINLRICTHAKNLQNKRLYKNNKTGFSGVRKSGEKWCAIVRFNGQDNYLGTFQTKEEANEIILLFKKEKYV